MTNIGPISDSRATPITERVLLASTNETLDRLFRASPAGLIPDGDTRGTVLAWPGTWLAKLNALRAQVRTLMTARYANYATNNPNSFVTNSTLAPLADPGTQAAREDLMFRERAFWLFGTGHRLGDLRRMIRQYGRGAETVFPTGTWHKGGPIGPDVNLVVAFREEQNSLFVRANCKTNVP